MTYWEKVTSQNHKDSSLISELSDLSYRSIGGRRQEDRKSKEGIVNIGTIPFQLTPPPNKITKEMIIDYQKNQDKPFEVIDPTTGNITNYKYRPSEFVFDVADLKVPVYVDEGTLGRPARLTDIEPLNLQLHTLSKDLEREYEILKKHQEDVVKTQNLINSRTLKTNAVNAAKKRLKTYETNVTATEAKIVQLTNNDIPAVETQIQLLKDNIQENKEIENAVNQENKSNVNKYKEALQTANYDKTRGLEREPNESDNDFLVRMKNMETELYDTNLYQDKAILEQINKFRLNLKTLIRKDDLIDNVIKSFTGDQIFIINKNFNAIKEKFLDRYGFNNTDIRTSDVVDELVNALDKILNPITVYEMEKEDTITNARNLSQATTDPDIEFGTENNSFYIGSQTNGKHIWLKIGKKANAKIVFFSTNLNQQGSFNQIRKQGYPQEERITYLFFNYLKLEEQVFREVLEGALDVNSLYDKLESKFGLTAIEDIKSKKINDITGSRRWGWGISHPSEEIPNYAKFGNLELLLNKLFYKNILSLRYKSGHSIEGFKNTKVSDTFVEIIMRMYRDENVDSLVKNLSNTEIGLYNSILYMAGLHKKFNANHKETLDELKERFKICEGEIVSGNDNPEVMKELKEILLKLHHLNAISLKSIKKYLNQFN